MFSLWPLIITQGSIKHNNGSCIIDIPLSQNRRAACSTRSRIHLCNAGAGESHDDCHDVDGELELQELGDAIVDVTAPHHSLYDAGEVVVCQDDIRGFLGHVGSSNTLGQERANETADTTI